MRRLGRLCLHCGTPGTGGPLLLSSRTETTSGGTTFCNRIPRERDFRPASYGPDRERPAITTLKKSETLAYAIGVDAPRGSNDPDKRFDREALERLTDPTGGYTRVVTDDREIPAAAEGIRDQLNQQYVLGFVPEHPQNGRFHRISITVTGCECQVRARAGFVANRAK